MRRPGDGRQTTKRAATKVRACGPTERTLALHQVRMKTLAVAMVIVGGLAAWIPAAGAEEYSPDTTGRHRRERTQTYAANTAGNNVRDRGEPAVTSADKSNAKSDLARPSHCRRDAEDRHRRQGMFHERTQRQDHFCGLPGSLRQYVGRPKADCRWRIPKPYQCCGVHQMRTVVAGCDPDFWESVRPGPNILSIQEGSAPHRNDNAGCSHPEAADRALCVSMARRQLTCPAHGRTCDEREGIRVSFLLGDPSRDRR